MKQRKINKINFLINIFMEKTLFILNSKNKKNIKKYYKIIIIE